MTRPTSGKKGELSLMTSGHGPRVSPTIWASAIPSGSEEDKTAAIFPKPSGLGHLVFEAGSASLSFYFQFCSSKKT